MTAEEFRAIPGFPGYQISNLGTLVSLLSGKRHIRQWTIENGYWRAMLRVDGHNRKRGAHQLVALAFIGPRPAGLDVCHGDGDKANNTPGNLRYGTRSENMLDVVRHGNHIQANKTHCAQGHEFTPANTGHSMSRGTPQRVCRKCSVVKVTASRARRQAVAA